MKNLGGKLKNQGKRVGRVHPDTNKNEITADVPIQVSVVADWVPNGRSLLFEGAISANAS